MSKHKYDPSVYIIFGFFGVMMLYIVVLLLLLLSTKLSVPSGQTVRVESSTWSGEGILIGSGSNFIVVEVNGVRKTIHGTFTYDIIGEDKR